MACGRRQARCDADNAALAGSDSAAGNALLAEHFPAASGNPTSVLLRFGTPVWSDAGVVARAERRLAAVPSFSGRTGPLDVNGVVFALVVGSQPGGGPYRAVLASLALGILMDAFLVRTLLVPSAVALLGRWNWWPSAYGSPAVAVSSSPRLAGTCGR